MKKLVFALMAMSFSVAQASQQSDWQMKSTQGKELSIQYFEGSDGGQIPIEDLNPNATVAEICGENVDKMKEVVLWMPGHGHGSAPTSLTERENGCMVVENIEFIMLGHWELRLSFEDGDSAVFNANVSY